MSDADAPPPNEDEPGRRKGRTIGDAFLQTGKPKVLRDMDRWSSWGQSAWLKDVGGISAISQQATKLQVGSRWLSGSDQIAKAYRSPLADIMKWNAPGSRVRAGVLGFDRLSAGLKHDVARQYRGVLGFDVLSESVRRDFSRQWGDALGLNDQIARIVANAGGSSALANFKAIETPLMAAKLARTERWKELATAGIGVSALAKQRQSAMLKAFAIDTPALRTTLAAMRATPDLRDAFPAEAFDRAEEVLDDLTVEEIEEALAAAEAEEDVEDRLAETLLPEVQRWCAGRPIDADVVYVIAFACVLAGLFTLLLTIPPLHAVWNLAGGTAVGVAHLAASKTRRSYLETGEEAGDDE